jgi:F-type H+-transporting ATPase subunit b
MFNWWTFAFEIINFIVVVYILYRLLFRPVRDVIIKRREEIEQSKTEIAEGKEEAERLKAEFEERLRELHELKESALEEARAEALKERERILDETKEEIERAREKLKRQIEEERKRLYEEIMEKGVDIATELSGRIISSVMDRELNEALVRKVIERISSLTEEEKAELLDARGEVCRIHISSPYPLSENQMERIEASVADLLNCRIESTFSEAPELIGGLLIRINGKVFDGTIKGNIVRITEELKGR